MFSGGQSSRLIIRAAAAVMIILLTVTAANLQLLAPIDRFLQASRFALNNTPPTGSTVLVEIDAESLAHIGVWPWPRQIHAQILDRLMELGAAEVAFDIDFSTASSPAGDQALEEALESAGGYAYLAAFQQTSTSGATLLNLPLSRFLAHSDPVLVNVDSSAGEVIRSVPASLAGEYIPSLAAALVPASAASNRITIDYSIDLNAVQRIPVSAILAGAIEPALISNRQVIVGATAVELRDFFPVPRFGIISGPMVQLAATETLKLGRNLVDLAALPAIASAAIGALLFVLGGWRAGAPRVLLASVAAGLTLEVVGCFALHNNAMLLETSAFHLASAGFMALSFLEERADQWRASVRQRARIAYLAQHDPVTGALTRHAFIEQAKEHWLQSGSNILTVVQLDRFDGVVETLGHEVADKLGTEIVKRLAVCVGRLPAKIGRDVFAFFHAQDGESAMLASCLSQTELALNKPYEIEGHQIVVSAVFGSSMTADETDPEECLRQAEIALSAARRTKTSATVFKPKMNAHITRKRQLDLALRKAIEQDELHLLFQPQVNLIAGDLCGVEALMRWESAELGMVSPAEFIPLAEETGLIVSLGEWAMRDACRQAAQWQWSGRLSVNVSAAQFRLSDVVAMIKRAAADADFPPSRLDVEITESLFVEDDDAILGDLEVLRALGAKIAMDDFGTGYSSLSYMSRLPIDKIKIDQSFVRPLPNPDAEVIVETVVAMSRRMGKTVIAEGVETQEQAAYLRHAGCDLGQGYLFGRPSRAAMLGLECSSRPSAA
jgi:predicted signal transduction protein with EAL and GGDEF domain